WTSDARRFPGLGDKARTRLPYRATFPVVRGKRRQGRVFEAESQLRRAVSLEDPTARSIVVTRVSEKLGLFSPFQTYMVYRFGSAECPFETHHRRLAGHRKP